MLPDSLVRPRTGDRAPIIRAWGVVVVTRRMYHWCDPFETIDEGFECPHLHTGNGIGGVVRFAQDVFEWDHLSNRWADGSHQPCGYCLPHGLVVIGAPAWRRLVMVPLRVADQVPEATAA